MNNYSDLGPRHHFPPFPHPYAGTPNPYAAGPYPRPQSLFPTGLTPMNSMLAVDYQNAPTQDIGTGTARLPPSDLPTLLQPLNRNVDSLLQSQQGLSQDLQHLRQTLADLKQALIDSIRQLRDETTANHEHGRQQIAAIHDHLTAIGHAIQPEPQPGDDHHSDPIPPAPQAQPPKLSRAVQRSVHNKLWVGGFFAHMQLHRLHHEFAKFGEIGSFIRGGKGWAVLTYVRSDDAARAQTAMHGKWAKPGRRPGIKVTPWTSARLPDGADYIQSDRHKQKLARQGNAQPGAQHPTAAQRESRAGHSNRNLQRAPKQGRAPQPAGARSHSEHAAGRDGRVCRPPSRQGASSAARSPSPPAQEQPPAEAGHRRAGPSAPAACARSACDAARDGRRRSSAQLPCDNQTPSRLESRQAAAIPTVVAGPQREPEPCPSHHASPNGGDAPPGEQADARADQASETGRAGSRSSGSHSQLESPLAPVTQTDDSHRHHESQPSSQSPAPTPPGSHPRHGGRLPGPFGADTPPETEEARKQRILADYTPLPGGIHVLRTKAWQRYHDSQLTGLVAEDVPGVGNCFYECLVQHRQVPNSETLTSFTAVKKRILTVARKASTRNSLCSCPPPEMPALAGLTTDNYPALLAHLATNGSYAEEVHIQFAALALKVNFCIHNITSPAAPGSMFWGSPSREEANLNTIHLLIRAHNIHDSYDQDFKPIPGGKADGHFWRIGNKASCEPGNGKGSAVIRPQKQLHH